MDNSTKMANRFGHNLKFYKYDSTAAANGYKSADEPIIIDFANSCQLETTSELTWATGGQGFKKLISFGNPIEGTYTISTQVSNMNLIAMIAGEDPSTFNSKKVTWSNKDKKTVYYVMEGETVYKDTDGNIVPEVVTLHKVAFNKSYGNTYSGDGDPQSMDVVLDLAANEEDNVFTITRGEDETTPTP